MTAVLDVVARHTHRALSPELRVRVAARRDEYLQMARERWRWAEEDLRRVFTDVDAKDAIAHRAVGLYGLARRFYDLAKIEQRRLDAATREEQR